MEREGAWTGSKELASFVNLSCFVKENQLCPEYILLRPFSLELKLQKTQAKQLFKGRTQNVAAQCGDYMA